MAAKPPSPEPELKSDAADAAEGAPAVPTPAKRGRGRPPRDPNAVKEAALKPKGRRLKKSPLPARTLTRGRRPLKKAKLDGAAATAAAPAARRRKTAGRGRPKKSTAPDVGADSVVASADGSTSRKRGRPKKSAEPGTVASSDVTPKSRRRGRPKAGVQSAVQKAAKDLTTPKKSRGRPKRTVLDVGETPKPAEAVGEAAEGEAKLKKKRGRPASGKKAAKPVGAAAENPETPTGEKKTKRVGRPKKGVAEKKEGTLASSGKRGRGRPKKSGTETPAPVPVPVQST